jgi:hypothetical protein
VGWSSTDSHLESRVHWSGAGVPLEHWGYAGVAMYGLQWLLESKWITGLVLKCCWSDLGCAGVALDWCWSAIGAIGDVLE